MTCSSVKEILTENFKSNLKLAFWILITADSSQVQKCELSKAGFGILDSDQVHKFLRVQYEDQPEQSKLDLQETESR